MKRLCSSDWQLDHNPRDRYRTDFVVNALPELIKKYNVDQLLMIGDVTENKDNHPAQLVNEIVDAFYNLSQLCEVIILEGNHDYLHEAHPFFAFLSKFKNVEWIGKPAVRDNCLFLPHTRDYKTEWKDVDLIKDYSFIFAHNIFTGVNAANGFALSGIPPNIFPESATVISGDVHDPQVMADGKIIYVGSPCLCSFGDNYQPRVLLLDDLKIKSIKVYGQQKRLINCAVNRIAGKRELAFDHNANENDIVKIQTSLTTEDVAEWATIREEVEKWAIQNKFIVNSIIPIVEFVQGERQKATKSFKKSDEQYLNALVSRQSVDEKTSEVGKQIIELI